MTQKRDAMKSLNFVYISLIAYNYIAMLCYVTIKIVLGLIYKAI